MSLNLHETTQRILQKVLTLSWKVDECKPLVPGGVGPMTIAILLQNCLVGRCRLTTVESRDKSPRVQLLDFVFCFFARCYATW